MLQIKITGIKNFSTGELNIENNGSPSPHGNSEAVRKEDVHWKIAPHCGVASIVDIKMKTGPNDPPSTNIFSAQPPKPQNDNPSAHWKVKVNKKAPVFSEYNYYIDWMPEIGGQSKRFDPKISVRPGINFLEKKVTVLVAAIAALLLSLLVFGRNKKNN